MKSIKNLSGIRNSKIGKRNSSSVPRAAVEALEGRTLLSSVVVNSVSDTATGAGVVTLRDAVSIANSSTTPTAITFDSSVFKTAQTITLDGTTLEASGKEPVSITAPAAGVTINGNHKSTVFLVDKGANATISGLKITGGFPFVPGGVLNGGGIENDGTLKLQSDAIVGNTGGNGGGIDNSGTLVFNDGSVSDNQGESDDGAGGDGGGIENELGAVMTLTNITVSTNTADNSGGIENLGTATLTGVTVASNLAQGIYFLDIFTAGASGGIGNYGTLTMTDCTVAGNNCQAQGAGIGNFGKLTLADSTLAGNATTSVPEGGLFGPGTPSPADGGGLYMSPGHSSAIIENTVIAENSESGGSGPDVFGAVQSRGCNLIGKTNSSTGWKSTDLTGTSAYPLNAELAALGNYGGPTQTMPPLYDSPVIDHGSNALVPAELKTDQRGLPRIVGSSVDIGADEGQATVKVAFPFAVATGTVGKPIGNLTVVVEDAYGNIATTNDSTVTLSLASGPPGAEIDGTLTAQITDGVAVFNAPSFTKAGKYTLKAFDDSLKSAISGVFAIVG